MEHFDGGLWTAFARYPNRLRAHMIKHHIMARLRRLWLAIRSVYRNGILLLDAKNPDVQRRHLPVEAYLADGWDVVDQIELGHGGVFEKNVEVTIVHDPADVEKLLSDRVFNFFQLAHDVKVSMLLHELQHRLINLILRVVFRVFL